MERYMFFNSFNGDRVYDAADFASYFSKLVSNGIFYTIATNLKVSAGAGMTVIVAAGSAWINGYSYENTTDLTLTVPAANGINDRIDRVVLRWSNLDRDIQLAVKTGTAAASPTPPALTRNGDIYELGLADVKVDRAAASIPSGNISDTRLDTNLCGTVNALISAVYQ